MRHFAWKLKMFKYFSMFFFVCLGGGHSNKAMFVEVSFLREYSFQNFKSFVCFVREKMEDKHKHFIWLRIVLIDSLTIVLKLSTR